MESKLKRFAVLVTRNGLNITHVYAENEEAAKDAVRETLCRPGRAEIYRMWVNAGSQVQEEPL